MNTLSQEQAAIYRQNYQQRLARQQQAREKRRQQALHEALARIPAIAAEISSIQQVYLYGSVLQIGCFQAHSDVDAAVVGVTAVDYFAFWRELETALPGWVIDLRDVGDNSSFAENVKEAGMLVYERIHPSTAS